MKISEAIQIIKNYHQGISRGAPIVDATSRDQVLYGDPERELTGIVTTCYASVDVIRRAKELGANLVISHEALFWNHGDHIDWLRENKTFRAKTALLDEGGITVWRDHDYIHSGIPVRGGWADGIFDGLMWKLGWQDYVTSGLPRNEPKLELPQAVTVRELGAFLMEKLRLNGIKMIGSPDSPAKRIWVCGHIAGFKDNQILQETEEEDFDTLITLECNDYTVAEYIRDCNMVGRPKTILATGHFNTEEPGMEYMAQWLPAVLGGAVPVTFVPCADMYCFLP